MNSLYEPHLFGSCIRELGKSYKRLSPLCTMSSIFKKERKLSPSIYLSLLLISKFPLFSSIFLVVYKKGIIYFSLTLHFIIISQQYVLSLVPKIY